MKDQKEIKMNVQLKTGGKVHASHNIEGVQNTPKCGGNKAAERYEHTTDEVTCKRCLKKLGKVVAPAAKPEAPKNDQCPNSGLVNPNSRRLYGKCKNCGKEGKNQGGKLRAHAPAK